MACPPRRDTGPAGRTPAARPEPLPLVGALGDHVDPLAGPVDVVHPHPEQFDRAGAAGDVELQQGAITLTAHAIEQLVPQTVGNRTGRPVGDLLPKPGPPHHCPRLQRAPVRKGMSTLRRDGDGVDHRPVALMGVEPIKAADHRQCVVDRPGRVSGTERRLAGPEVHRPGHVSARLSPLPLRIRGRPQPPRQHRDLGLGRLLPCHPQQPQQPEPPQQAVPVAAYRQRAAVVQCQIPQVGSSRLDLVVVRVHDDVRRVDAPSGDNGPHRGSSARPSISSCRSSKVFLLVDRIDHHVDQRGS